MKLTYRFLPLLLLASTAFTASTAFAQKAALAPAKPTQTAPSTQTDPLASLDFLLGTWVAGTNAAGSASASVLGTYTFSRDLGGHALQRTGTVATCKGPQDFDCNHHDQLTIFSDDHGQTLHGAALFALYLDNEGHVIYYTVATPDTHTAIFTSQGLPTLPKFRLTYHLEGDGPKAVMSGKFQFAPPGSDEYHSYLEWSGTRQ